MSSLAPVCSTYDSESFCENGNVKIGNARDPIASTRLVHNPAANFFWGQKFSAVSSTSASVADPDCPLCPVRELSAKWPKASCHVRGRNKR
jgi:hypothetical protein